MPIYVYEVIEEDGRDGEQFEVVQSMNDAPLTTHPESGRPVRRVYTAPAIGGKWSEAAMGRAAHDDKKLERLGFTKYVKSADGKYEKTVGSGPDMISGDKPLPGE